MSRLISFSEIDTLLTCPAKWDFGYSDQLAGSSLRSKAIAPRLRAGRAWGAAVGAWHLHADQVTAGQDAIDAMDVSLNADADQQREHGVHDEAEHRELREHLLKLLMHYSALAEPTQYEDVERHLLVSIPSRTGVRSSTRFKFVGYIDGVERDRDGDHWLHEHKLRTSLLPAEMLTNSRQVRWYAWAFQRMTGIRIDGAWITERLNEAPKPPRMVQGRRKGADLVPSHAKDQMCMPDAYISICQEHDEEPHEDTVEALRHRRWQQRVPVLFRDGELEQAGRELVSAAQQITLLEHGELEPLRNVKQQTCSWCTFRDICPSPDSQLVDALFERRMPKRDRELYAHTAQEGAAQ